jgi:hypothetical protein
MFEQPCQHSGRKKPETVLRHDLAFLHTAAIHQDSFEKLCKEIAPSLKVRHVVDESLLAQAREHGITDALAVKVNDAVFEAAATGAAVVVCTCSTLGGLAEATNTAGEFIAMRIDRAMADIAVSTGERVLVIAALASTLEPTRSLLQSSARNANVHIHLAESLVDDAWAFFESADRNQYHQLIASAVQTGLEKADVIVLAQASMAGVAECFSNAPKPVLSSPRLGVKAAVDMFTQKKP